MCAVSKSSKNQDVVDLEGNTWGISSSLQFRGHASIRARALIVYVGLLNAAQKLREGECSFMAEVIEEWRLLCKQALFETTRERIPDRIAEAEEALARRSRELFALGLEASKERQDIESALCSMKALSYCLGLRPKQALHEGREEKPVVSKAA